MAAAGPGGILVSGPIQQAVGQAFSFEPRPPLPMKGKAEPLPVFGLLGERRQRAIRLQEPTYALPMVGRQRELETIEQKLALALAGQAQLVGIVAEAGLGKSRLVAEVIRSGRRQGFAGYGGACQSDAVNTPYQAWKAVWSALFDVDPSAPLKRQIRLLAGEIEALAPERAPALPLLGPVLDLDIPDNDFTRTLEPKARKGALHALLEDCLKAAARDEPLLIVVEDLHWIDAASHDLLEDLARAVPGERICFVLAYRPPQLARLVAPRLESLGQFTRIELAELTPAECEQAIRAKLAQLYPARGGALPPGLVERLMAHAQGNPFYLEELLNFLRDRGLDPHDPAALEHIELPESLHTLILSRIDQLSEREKATLRAASVVGRLFRARWLVGYYPALGEYGQVAADLDELASLDITPLDTPEPELAYLFKHVVTQEVAYESLPYATRARLHEHLGLYLEKIAAPVEAIAHHYGLSRNRAKQREYWRKAGEAAQAAYANQAALEYFASLLRLVTGPQEKIDLHLKRGDLYSLIGLWSEAEAECRTALDLAGQTRNARACVRCQLAWGRLAGSRGDYSGARQWAEQALAGAEALADPTLQAQSALNCGQASLALGDYAGAEAYCERALAEARAQGDLKIAAGALGTLATIARDRSQPDLARSLFEESLKLGRQLGERLGAKGIAVMRQSGTSANIAGVLCNNGFIACQRQDYAQAQFYYAECLRLIWPTKYRGHDWARAWAGLARTFLEQPATLTHGVQLAALGEKILHEMGATLWPIERTPLDEALASARTTLGEGAFNAVWAAGQALTLEAAIALAQEPDGAQPQG